MTSVSRSRSRDLLKNLIKGGEMAATDICRELGLAEADLDQLVAGTTTMSTPQQLLLANLLIEKVPRLAKGGRSLRDQAIAAKAFAEGAITSHNSQPVKWSGLKASRV